MKLFPFKLYKVSGHSMEPVLKPGQYVLGQLSKHLKKGGLAIVEWHGEMLLKRIKEINSGGVYLAGDNTYDSLDSRSFGWLPKTAVTAKAIWY